MWSTAERRFTRHVICLRHPFRPFHFGIPSIQSLPEAGSWERQYAPPVLHYACIMPIPSLYLQKNEPVSCREAKRLVKQLWSPRFVTIQWLCCQLCYVTAANQWRIVEIELLATVGWKWGCQPFSRPCSQNVTHCQKEVCSTCLFKASIPAVPVWKCQASTPYQKLEVPESGSTLYQLCIMVASCPSLRCNYRKKHLSHAENQSVWSSSSSCGLQDLLQWGDCALSCAMWLLQTNEQFSRLSFWQQWVGSGAASLSAADVCKMWSTAERRCARHVCVRHPFRPFHFGIPSIQSLPEAGSWERQYAPPVLHYACIMPIPSLHLQKYEPVSRREATRLVKQLWSPRFYMSIGQNYM